MWRVLGGPEWHSYPIGLPEEEEESAQCLEKWGEKKE